MSESKNSVLITGCSSGIGKAVALLLDNHGYRVFAGIRNNNDAEKLKLESSSNLEPIILDVTNNDQIQAAFNFINEQCYDSGLMCVINNAGYMHAGSIEYSSEEDIKRQYDVNFFGTIRIIQTFLPLIRRFVEVKKHSGRIINIGSVAGRLSTPFTGIYNSSKSAIAVVSEALCIELATSNIHSCLIEPGSIATQIWQKIENNFENAIFSLPEGSKKYYESPMKAMQNTLIQTGGRGISPDMVAKVVIRSLESNNPKNRYLVGAEAKIVATLTKFLPERFKYKITLNLTK